MSEFITVNEVYQCPVCRRSMKQGTFAVWCARVDCDGFNKKTPYPDAESLRVDYKYTADEKTASIVKRARAKAAEYNEFADKVESGAITATEMKDGTLFCVHHPGIDPLIADRLNRFFEESRHNGRNRVEIAPHCPDCLGTGYFEHETCYRCDGQG